MTDPTALLGWRESDPPLVASACVASGPVAPRLVERLLTRVRLDDLSGVVAENAIVLLGPAASLPWTDGVLYLGRHKDAPGVLFPTTSLPGGPLDLVARAIRSRVREQELPVAVLPEAGRWRIYPLGSARPLGRAELRLALKRLELRQ